MIYFNIYYSSEYNNQKLKFTLPYIFIFLKNWNIFDDCVVLEKSQSLCFSSCSRGEEKKKTRRRKIRTLIYPEGINRLFSFAFGGILIEERVCIPFQYGMELRGWEWKSSKTLSGVLELISTNPEFNISGTRILSSMTYLRATIFRLEIKRDYACSRGERERERHYTQFRRELLKH